MGLPAKTDKCTHYSQLINTLFIGCIANLAILILNDTQSPMVFLCSSQNTTSYNYICGLDNLLTGVYKKTV